MKPKQFSNIADTAARKATERLQEHLQDVAQTMTRDQAEWLDKVMADILPPHLYEAGRHGDSMQEIGEYLKKHKFQIVFIPDSMAIRIMRHDQIHAQFVPQLTVDGEPVEMHRSGLELN
jgi:hypothetical protein